MEIPQQLYMGRAPVSRRGRGPPGAKAAAALAAHASAHGSAPPLREGTWQQQQYHADQDRCSMQTCGQTPSTLAQEVSFMVTEVLLGSIDLHCCSFSRIFFVHSWEADGSGRWCQPEHFLLMRPGSCLCVSESAACNLQSAADSEGTPLLLLGIAKRRGTLLVSSTGAVAATGQQCGCWAEHAGLLRELCCSLQQWTLTH